MSTNITASVRELASKEDIKKATDRGIQLGNTGMFLDYFIEIELQLMQRHRLRH
jgi:hypothetical protein